MKLTKGDVFGYWTVIDYAAKSKYRCECVCKVIKIVSYHSLKKGKSKSCGCRMMPSGRPPKIAYDNIIGAKFGYLTVTTKLPNQNKSAIFLCRCDCGTEVSVMWGNLRLGRTKSCGCNRFKKLALEEVIQRRMWNDYVSGARYRNLPFTLSREQFRDIINAPCYYCGHVPSGVSTEDRLLPDRYGKGIYDKKNRFNGVDRKDNSRGYELDNVVPCCTLCNRAKWAMNDDEFLLWVRRVYLHNKESEVYRKE